MQTVIRKFRHQKRKLFFPVGMFSLCLFPLFGFSTLFLDSYFHKVYVIEYASMSPKMRDLMQPDLEKANAPVIPVQGNLSERKKIITSFSHEIDFIRKSSPDSFIFHFILKEEATWSDFIEIIDVCKKKQVKQYAVDHEHIWIWSGNYIRPRVVEKGRVPFCGNTRTKEVKSERLWMCGTGLYEDYSVVEKELHNDPVDYFLNYRYRYIIISIFCLLIFLNFTKIRRIAFQ